MWSHCLRSFRVVNRCPFCNYFKNIKLEPKFHLQHRELQVVQSFGFFCFWVYFIHCYVVCSEYLTLHKCF
uniref:Uncharacterized protein n=1 Tax=Anguilla anguilla TaxID=7936 RepID=A0A0E9SDQ7_ANGAN